MLRVYVYNKKLCCVIQIKVFIIFNSFNSMQVSKFARDCSRTVFKQGRRTVIIMFHPCILYSCIVSIFLWHGKEAQNIICWRDTFDIIEIWTRMLANIEWFLYVIKLIDTSRNKCNLIYFYNAWVRPSCQHSTKLDDKLVPNIAISLHKKPHAHLRPILVKCQVFCYVSQEY